MDVNKSLSEECKSQLQTTPFGWLLNLHCNIEASGRMLEVMATSWNADARAFQVGDRLIPFTLYDIALILGLPVRGEPIDCNQSHSGGYAWGKAVYDFLVSGLSRAASSMQAKKGRGNLHIQGCTALLQIWACEHLGIGQKNAEINPTFPKIFSMDPPKNVLSVLVAMPWEQEFNVVEEAMETLQETHGSSHPTISRDDGAGPSNRTQTPSNQLQLELQAERAEREALARQVGRLKDELDHVKGLVATLPIQTPIVDLPSSPSKAVKRGKAAKKKAKVAMVDLASSPSKRDNAGEAAAAVVDLVSSPSKGATSVRYTRAKTRAHKNLMIVAPQSEPVRNEWVDAHFLYQPTAADEAVLADFRKKWGGATRRATRRRPNEVDSNEVAISTETYELTGREVSSLLGDEAQDDGSRWISTATTILGMSQSTSTQRGKRTRKGKQPIQDDQPQPQSVFRPSWVRAMPGNCNRIFVPACHSGHFVMLVVDCLEKVFYFFDSLPSATHRALAPTLRKALEQICIENLGHKDVHTWLLEYKDDIPTQDKYA
uniref:Aminotransferase-like plant mobile domain-containing protein n=1 Tax=Fagus sylvatica TaxID=28930 RepID=A0A2N9GQV0_FAGSY